MLQRAILFPRETVQKAGSFFVLSGMGFGGQERNAVETSGQGGFFMRYSPTLTSGSSWAVSSATIPPINIFL